MDPEPNPAKRPDTVRDADDEARVLARDLLGLRHAALAWTDPDTAAPGIRRIAFGLAPDRTPLTFISALAPHFAALHADPACALLLGEPGTKGDPLTHARLMIRAKAQFVGPLDPLRGALRDQWLKDHPKAALYIDFTDFAFVLLRPQSALLNAGFARAYRLTPDDLTS